jgi:hypothetical protein
VDDEEAARMAAFLAPPTVRKRGLLDELRTLVRR